MIVDRVVCDICGEEMSHKNFYIKVTFSPRSGDYPTIRGYLNTQFELCERCATGLIRKLNEVSKHD